MLPSVEIFKRFEKDVVKDNYFTTEQVLEKADKRISELADLFFTCLTASKEAYLHPNKSNTVVVRGKEVKVNSKNYRIFFSQFKQEYKPSELEIITANKDRILEDIYRRYTGAFFTPDIWVDEAHNLITEQFGENWKDEYVVWDCAAGTFNLTRGYKFKELYISTLDQSDINTAKDCGYNTEATIFQYDFLNEVGIDSCPDNLKKAFEEGKKILFFINPPYGTAKHYDIKNGESKVGIANTILNEIMKQHKIGSSSQQLYTQFMYKISLLQEKYKNINIGIFTPLFMAGSSFVKFRNVFYNNFDFMNGILFQASNFSDVKGMWGISFTIWKNTEQLKDNKIILDIKEINVDTYEIEKIGEKEIYGIEDKEASKWVRKEVKNMKTLDAPQMTSAIGVKQEGRGKIVKDALGYIHSNANNIYHNIQLVGLYSSSFSAANGFSIIPENYKKAIALFTARKTIIPNWINEKDEYLIPSTEHPDYSQWNNDCIIYTLFQSKAQQSSLRQVDYKNKKWDIINHFFFMSNEEMLELADDNNFNTMYQDVKVFNEDRYVYNLLKETTLSNDAKDVLEAGKDLIRKSMSIRVVYHENNPKYHLNAWDASWAQLKPMFKEHFKEKYTIFVKKYKEFEDRMREGVYRFGFLK